MVLGYTGPGRPVDAAALSFQLAGGNEARQVRTRDAEGLEIARADHGALSSRAKQKQCEFGHGSKRR
jgi:hypothetical protein